jgi:hypothetical protein
MRALKPSERTRVSLVELAGGVTLEGSPSAATAVSARTGKEESLTPSDEGGFIPTVSAAPELLTLTWEVAGAAVTAQLDVVASRYCSHDDVRGYRAEEYQLGDTPDEDVAEAIARAEEVIEHAAHRAFQPVCRTCTVDRPNCTPSTLAMTGDGTAADIRSVVRATGQDGEAVYVGCIDSCRLDVSNLPPRTFAEVVLIMGMDPTPSDVRSAVTALAAWYLSPSNRPENATSESTDAGVLNFVIGGVDGAPTSLPEVNALIERHGLRDWRVG